jgi:membrane protein YqaA with SNARE-associated domain
VQMPNLRSWLKLAIGPLGGIGLLFASLVDSSFVPLPLVTDLGLIDLSSRHPGRMPYYAAMATIGSLAGCIWIYYLARKGGEAYYRKTQRHRPARIRKLVEDYPLACVFLPSVAPFPVPFKPFVVAEGVFQVPVPEFVIGTLAGRGCLFFFEGFLGVKYGAAAKELLMNQKGLLVVVALVLGACFLLIRRLATVPSGKVTQVD